MAILWSVSEMIKDLFRYLFLMTIRQLFALFVWLGFCKYLISAAVGCAQGIQLVLSVNSIIWKIFRLEIISLLGNNLIEKNWVSGERNSLKFACKSTEIFCFKLSCCSFLTFISEEKNQLVTELLKSDLWPRGHNISIYYAVGTAYKPRNTKQFADNYIFVSLYTIVKIRCNHQPAGHVLECKPKKIRQHNSENVWFAWIENFSSIVTVILFCLDVILIKKSHVFFEILIQFWERSSSFFYIITFQWT